MTQTAHNTTMTIPDDSWVQFSEINCTFVVEQGVVQVIGTQDAAPAASARGITYRMGQGQDVDYDMLGRFAGAGTANRLYARAPEGSSVLFVSRAAVA